MFNHPEILDALGRPVEFLTQAALAHVLWCRAEVAASRILRGK